MVEQAVRVGAVDIGTNSMRLLVRDENREFARLVEVTGLGKGVDATGRLAEDAVDRTVEVLSGFGKMMSELEVAVRRAVATSASRDASNTDMFVERAAAALGVRPDIISGDEEAALAFAGATAGLDRGDWLICDIGGGSTEFVTQSEGVSIDIGSVRLTDAQLPDRPPGEDQLAAARRHVLGLFADVSLSGDLIGVAGTWTSLAAISLDLARYDRDVVHGHRLDRSALDRLVETLASKTVAETAAIPSLDPKRAPVILAGAVIAQAAMTRMGEDSIIVSEKDSLDGLAMAMLGLP